MTSGGTNRFFARALLAGASLLAVCAPASALDLPEVMGLLSERRHGEASFTEERFVSGLDRPLRSSGVVSFSAPDHFTRRTLQPQGEVMVVEGQRVRLERGGRVRQVGLDAVPELAAIATAVRATLTGDADALRLYFDPTVSGDAANWSILLKPLDPRLLATVQHLRIDGQHAEVRQVEIVLADGDRSVMRLEPLGEATPGKPRASTP